MIKAIWSDGPSFRRVEFRNDFNVILAETTTESTTKGSRNGLGKTSLIEIIHFLLGSSGFYRVKGTPAEDWTFFGLFAFGNDGLVVSRSQRKPGRIGIDSGDLSPFERLGITITHEEGSRYISVNSWVSFLGSKCFDLPIAREANAPSFRSLIGYFIRRGKDAFSSPFEHYRKQATWDIQVNNAYLLNLEWRDAQRAQELRDRAQVLQTVQRAADLGMVSDYFGKRGELEVERANLEAELSATASQLRTFQVAPQYSALEEDADALTAEINELVNSNYSDRLIISDYKEVLTAEKDASYLNVEDIYREAGVAFKEGFLRDLGDVRRFHDELIKNRKAYLEGELAKLGHAIEVREKRIAALDSRRASYLRALEANRALEHYAAMRVRVDELQSLLTKVNSKLQALNDLEESKAKLKIDTEVARQATLQHYDERRKQRDRAVSLFSEASLRLYDAPGKLIINVGKDSGYTFDYEIERKGSGGYASGAVFCYDMALAQIWANLGLNVLAHDSILFEPLDERQTAHSLTFAAERCRTAGFQYICAINTDRIPSQELLGSLRLDDYVVLHLTDSRPEGSLFGFRFGGVSQEPLS